MISNYNLSCDYHNFELKDKIYLIPDWALKVIYTDGFNEVVFSGNSANVTILEGYDISFQEETSFDERFKFSKSVSIKVDGYKTFNDLDYRYCVVLETKEGEFYLVNSDFPSFVTHTYTLSNGTNSTELVFSSQSNIATLKLTNFEPNNVNLCKEYNIPKIKDVKLTEAWASYLSTWQKSLVNKGEFSDIEPLHDSISLTEEFDGEKYTVTLGFDIPMSYYKNDWHIKLLQFEENKYRGYIQLEDGNKAFVGYNVGLFPSYTINGDIISIRLTETAIRGIAYGNDYALVDTDIPNSIEFNGASCYTYNFESSCNWEVEEKPDYITITPTSGLADTQYELEICNTDDETGYAVSEFVIRTCKAVVKPEVVIKNPIYRYTATTETACTEALLEWVESGTTCAGSHGVDKYNKSIEIISFDQGETWEETGNESATTLIQANSPDCGYAEKWIDSGTTCIGYDKFNNAYKQVSYDSGSTWITPQPIQYSATTLNESKSEDCGYEIFSGKYKLFFKNSSPVSADCSSSNVITSGEIQTHTYCISALVGECARTINKKAFYNLQSMRSVIIYDGLKTIGDEAFNVCAKLTNIEIPNTVTDIGKNAFANCYILPKIELPSGLTEIKEGLFKSSRSLTSVTIPSGVTRIGKEAFMFCNSLISTNIPSGVTRINEWTYYACGSLTGITIPNSVGFIGNHAFNGCSSLTNITIPDNVTSIGQQAFQSCPNLTAITISNSLSAISLSTFANSGFINVSVPDSVTIIGNLAFSSCPNLTSVTIGSGVTNISTYSFHNCSALTSVTITAIYPPDIDRSFENTPIASGNGHIYVPSESVDRYKTASGWRSFASIIEAIP